MVRLNTLFCASKQYMVPGLILFTLVAGLIYSLYLGESLRYPDEYDYIKIAHNIIDNRGFSLDGNRPTAYRPPVYPGILAITVFAGGNIFLCRLLNYLALSASLFLVYLLVRKQAGYYAGVVAIVLTLYYPIVFYTAGTLYPQTIATLLLLAIVYLYFGYGVKNGKLIILIGILFGLLILTVPTFIFAFFFFCFWILYEHRKQRIKHVCALIVSCCLVVCPWTARNYAAFDSFVLVSSNAGLNLLLGNSENTTPNAGVNVDISSYGDAVVGMDEAEKDHYYARSAFDYILNNPWRAIRLYAFKFLNYFNYRNILFTKSEVSRLRELVMLFSYGPLLLLALVRLAAMRKFPLTRYERFAFFLYLLNGAFAAIFFTRIRFRVPFDFLLISICAIFLARVFFSQSHAQSFPEHS